MPGRWPWVICLVLWAAPTLAAGLEALHEAQQSAAAAMVAQQRDDGLFRYEFDFRSGRYTDNDFLVRQAGASYALADYSARRHAKGTLPSVRRALNGLAQASIPYADGQLVTVEGDPRHACAGCTALSLLAELRYFDASSDPRFAAQRRAWLAGLMSLRIPERGFRRSPRSSQESPYFNGEAWLALAVYRHMFPGDERIARQLQMVDAYMMARYRNEPHVGFYQWGTMAAAQRYADSGAAQFLHFAMEQTWIWLHRLQPDFHPRANTCAPLEGLATAAGLAAGHGYGALRRALRQRIERELRKVEALQVRPGQRELDLADGTTLRSERLPLFAGVFLVRAGEARTRIDFTQHCLSALLRYEDSARAR